MTTEEYSRLFPYSPLRSTECCERISEGMKQAYRDDPTLVDRTQGHFLGTIRSVEECKAISEGVRLAHRLDPTIGSRISATLRDGSSTAGISLSDEHRRSLSEGQLRSYRDDPTRAERVSKTMRENWRNPRFAESMVASWHKKPNKAESFLTDMLELRFPGKFKLNIDGSLSGLVYSWGYQGTRQPDMVRVDGIRQVLFVNGNYWHLLDDEDSLVMGFQEAGINCVVTWVDGWYDIITDWSDITQRIKEAK